MWSPQEKISLTEPTELLTELDVVLPWHLSQTHSVILIASKIICCLIDGVSGSLREHGLGCTFPLLASHQLSSARFGSCEPRVSFVCCQTDGTRVREISAEIQIFSSFSSSPIAAGGVCSFRPLKSPSLYRAKASKEPSVPLLAMDPSLSPQPSSSGLVCAELRASWPAWTGSVSHTSRPKATTPFHHASDFTYFDDPPAPKEKKKDPLVQILKDAGFETTPEPEPEPEPQVWSPAPLEEMFKHTEPPSRMTQKKGKRNERVTRDISEEEFQSSSHGTSSQRTDPMDPTAVSKLPLKIKLAPITSSNSSRVSSIIQSAQKTNPSPVKRPIPTAAKTRKRKTDDTSSHEQYLISSTQPTLRSKVSQKIQTAEAKTQSQPNIHLAQSIHDSAGIRSNETATKQDTQRKQNTVPSSKRRRQDEMIGSDPALRIQNSSPDATEPVLQYQDPVAKMIEIDSDGSIPVLEDRSLELTKPIVSNTAASSDNLLVPQLEQASEAVRFRASPEDEVETNHLPNQVFGRIAPNSSREGLRPARLSSTPNNSTEAETRSDIAGSSLMPGHEYAPDTPAPTREVKPEYTATSSLGSLCLKDSQNDNAPDFRAKFGGSTDIYHSAPEMLWKEAVTDDSPAMVLRHIVSVCCCCCQLINLFIANGLSVRRCIAPSNPKRMLSTAFQRSIGRMRYG